MDVRGEPRSGSRRREAGGSRGRRPATAEPDTPTGAFLAAARTPPRAGRPTGAPPGRPRARRRARRGRGSSRGRTPARAGAPRREGPDHGAGAAGDFGEEVLAGVGVHARVPGPGDRPGAPARVERAPVRGAVHPERPARHDQAAGASDGAGELLRELQGVGRRVPRSHDGHDAFGLERAAGGPEGRRGAWQRSEPRRIPGMQRRELDGAGRRRGGGGEAAEVHAPPAAADRAGCYLPFEKSCTATSPPPESAKMSSL